MKKIFLILALTLNLSVQFQTIEQTSISITSGTPATAQYQGVWNYQSLIPDYTLTTPYATYITIVSRNTVFQDVAKTIPAKNGQIVRAMTELISGKDALWESTETRNGYMNPLFGSSWNRQYGIYEDIPGEQPHVVMPQEFATSWAGAVTSHTSPNTKFMVIKRRGGPKDEAYSFIGAIKDNSNSYYSIGNNGTLVALTVGSGVAPVEVISILWMEDNGATSRLYLNNVQLGSDVTLTASAWASHQMGTGSHPDELNIYAFGEITGVLNSTDRTTFYNILAAMYPVGVKIQEPYAGNISLSFSGDTFTATTTFNQGTDALAVNHTYDKIEWGTTTLGTTPDGYTNLESKDIIPLENSLTLVRSKHKLHFPTPGNSQQNVFCCIGQSNTNGKGWRGIPLCSAILLDNVTGTATTQPQAPTSIVISNSTPNLIDLTYSGNIDNTTGNIANYTVTVDGLKVPISSISFPSASVLRLTMRNNIPGEGYVQVRSTYATNPLKGSNTIQCEALITGSRIGVTNNVNPVSQTVNLNFSLNGSSTRGVVLYTDIPPYAYGQGHGAQNNTSDGASTGVKFTSINDNRGYPTTIGINVTTAFANGNVNNVLPAAGTTNFPWVEYFNRGYSVGSGATGVLVITGLGAGKTVDLKLAFYRSSGGPGGLSGTCSIVGATTTNFTVNDSVPAEVVQTGLVADGSGQLTVTIVGGSGKVVALCGMIITKYL